MAAAYQVGEIAGSRDNLVKEIRRVGHCEDECRALAQEVAGLDPVLTCIQQFESQLSQNAAELGGWLIRLKQCLYEAQRLINGCQTEKINFWKRNSLRKAILKQKEQLHKLLRDDSIWVLLALQISYNAKDLLQNKDMATTGIKMANLKQNVADARGFLCTDNVLIHQHKEADILEECLIGREDVEGQIKDFLLKAEGSKKIGIHGIGGSGKTSIAKKVNNDPQIKSHFHDRVYWLTVGMQAGIQKLQGKLYEQIVHKPRHFLCKEEGKSELTHLLKGKQCLLILDDVWDKSVIEWLNYDTTILITTRNPEILGLGTQDVELGMLSEEHSWNVFLHHAFQSSPIQFQHDNAIHKDVKSIAARMAKKCKGLPLALKLAGSAMTGKSEKWQWEQALSGLQDAQLNQEEALYGHLKISYNELGSLEKHIGQGRKLQECFLYLGAFREYEKIDIFDLAKCWAGERLLKAGNDLMIETYFVLGILIASSLFDVVGENACRVHDVLRDMTYHILRKERIRQEVFHVGKIQDDINWQVAKRIYIGKSIPVLHVNSPVVAPNLNTLLLECCGEIHQKFLLNFPSLQVLSLISTGIKALPDSLGLLKSLVVLDIVECNSLASIPESLAELTNLEILRISLNNPASFPTKALLKLTNLSVLDLYALNGIWDSSINGKTLGFQCLQNLTKLRILRISSTTQKLLPASMENFSNLRFLQVQAPLSDILPLQKLVKLEHLELKGCNIRVLSDWVCKMKDLRRVILRGSRSLSRLPGLDALQKLVLLDLSYTSVTNLPPLKAGSFPRLETLYLTGCPFAEFPEIEKGALPLLRELNMDSCKIEKLKSSFVRTGSLPSLERLNLSWCRMFFDFSVIEEGALVKLQELNLGHCQIETLPASLGSAGCLSALKTLILTGCPLKELPISMQKAGSFPSLELLDASACALEGFPDIEEGAMAMLKVLKLSSSKIKQLPRCFGRAGCFTSLQHLHLSGCPLLHFPEIEKGALPRLCEIHVDDHLLPNLSKSSPFLSTKLSPNLMMSHDDF